MKTYDFSERLMFSMRRDGASFESMIWSMLPGVESVIKTETDKDKTGIDYIATLRRGAQVYIDLKLRAGGIAKHWKNGQEELALEKWSVLPNDKIGQKGKAGWTLDEAKETHYTLHAFSPEDSSRVFFLPFQLLRKAFIKYHESWYTEYRHAIQSSGFWQSECVFVPANVVMDAIREAMV